MQLIAKKGVFNTGSGPVVVPNEAKLIAYSLVSTSFWNLDVGDSRIADHKGIWPDLKADAIHLSEVKLLYVLLTP